MNAQRSLFHDASPTFDEVMSVWANDRKFRSRLKIAEALGRAKSPSLVAIIGALVGIGYLTVREVELPNRVIMYEYAATKKWEEDGRLS